MVAASCRSSRANSASEEDSFLLADRPCAPRRTETRQASQGEGEGWGDV